MLPFFSKKKKALPAQMGTASKTATHFSRFANKMQTGFAVWMAERERKMTMRQKKRAFAIYCVILITINIGFLYPVFFPRSANHQAIPHPQGITPPNDITLPDTLDIYMMEQMRKIRSHKDSISTHNKK